MTDSTNPQPAGVPHLPSPKAFAEDLARQVEEAGYRGVIVLGNDKNEFVVSQAGYNTVDNTNGVK